MELSTWLFFFATEAALCFTPGPAVLYVSSWGLSRGFIASLFANLGIVTGNTIYFVASALGVGAIILASGTLFSLLKWFGIAYLLWLAWTMITSNEHGMSPRIQSIGSKWRIYRGAVALQLANPKNLLFFMVILPPFIDPEGNVPFQVLILGVTSQVLELIALLTYGTATSRARAWLSTSPLAVWIERIAGYVLIGIACLLTLVERPEIAPARR